MIIEEKVQEFWIKVQNEYQVLVDVGGIAENRDYYLFQTQYSYSPDLMIVGINPGGDSSLGKKWICPERNLNMYIDGQHQWFKTLRNIFGYPDNEFLKPLFENCVGSNKIFINTGNVKKLPNSDILGPRLIRELVTDVIKPKHIVALGKDVFATLSNRKAQEKIFGKIKLVCSFWENTPICLVYNPSRINTKYFNSPELLKDWQDALKWFLIDNK